MRRLVLAFLLLIAVAAPSRADSWNPQRTWAFVVGVLEWKDGETWAPFPKVNRRDAQLVALLKQRGVPADHIVYLQDRAATRAAVTAQLPALLKRAAPGDELIVYYCGHGWKNDEGAGYFVTWDASDDMDASAWAMASVPKNIERLFRGRRALILADCCYSGQVAADALATPGKVGLAALTSSQSSVASTGNWTFTESVLLGLRGNPAVDLNHDGAVTLDEMARFTAAEMSFADEQMSTFDVADGYDPKEVMARTAGPMTPRLGERLEVKVDGTWWKARVIGSQSGRLQVHYYGYETTDDAWVAPSQIRSRQTRQFPQGAKVLVLWEKEWYPATVLKAQDGMHLIHYDGFKSTWDEWVDSKRIKPAS